MFEEGGPDGAAGGYGAAAEEQDPTTELAKNALLKLDDLLRTKRMKIVSLFHDRRYNVNGDDELDVDEFLGVCEKAQVELDREECSAIMTLLDTDGNGLLDFRELHAALRDSSLRPTLATRKAAAQQGRLVALFAAPAREVSTGIFVSLHLQQTRVNVRTPFPRAACGHLAARRIRNASTPLVQGALSIRTASCAAAARARRSRRHAGALLLSSARLYSPWRAPPRSACSCMQRVRTCSSSGRPLGSSSARWRLW